MAEVHVILNQAAMKQLLASPQGDVARDLSRRAIRVQSKARLLLSGSYFRVRTGRLRNSITWEIRSTGTGLVARIGTNVEYGIYLHEGTGVYGPRGRPITPKHGKFLRWSDPDSGKVIFARRVRGVRGRPYLKDALDAAL